MDARGQEPGPADAGVAGPRDAGAPGDLPAKHEIVEIQPRLWSLRVHGPLGWLIEHLSGLPVLDIEIDEPRLEDVLTRYYREESQ